MKKRMVSVLLAAVMTLSLMGCGAKEAAKEAPAAETPVEEAAAGEAEAEAPAPETASDVKATVIWRAFDDQFQSGFRIIMQNEEKKAGGISLDMQDAANDVSTAISKLEAALTKGTDVVAICAPDRESTETMAQKTSEEGVPAVFFNMEPMETTMQTYDNIYYVGAQAKESGEMCAQALINYWNSNKEIADKNDDGVLQLVILQGEIGQQDVVLRTQAYEETLKAQGIDYEVLAMDTANWDQAQALDKMNAWITAYGIDGIEGVLCNNDNMAMGAMQACINNGYNSGDAEKFVPIVGIDANIDALEAMKAGSLLGTVLNDRLSQSNAIINVIKAAKEGKEVTEEVVGVDCTVDGKYVWVPYVIVDSSNLDATLELMSSISQ
ncbi:monosaccharide ABC transporter substrate-binding protein (CUT2 family) [Kineothrix alysoides]|uniref:D-galactose/methyl-galactoside binding periplasmic protein MglB n=1 Tax=Kineothrix alysoides TaxID=1469948 RepID=A0A4R1QTQ9_9FIRM|nr:galactose ABC transporter substrate-binding protein [Kineothrix alysoides]TCL57316.1 monosaccharide ABC transporter substrate-binding protein (CUT2 family) [Kineothrix alysoides]